MIMENTSNNWFVLFVGAYSVDRLALMLEKAGYVTYSPMETVSVHWEGRTKRVHVPLFRSCLFVAGDWEKLSVFLLERKISVLVDRAEKPLSVSASKMELVAEFVKLLSL